MADECFGSGELFADGKYLGRVDGLALSLQDLADGLERFNSAMSVAAYEWPDEVIEDVLDADEIG